MTQLAPKCYHPGSEILDTEDAHWCGLCGAFYYDGSWRWPKLYMFSSSAREAIGAASARRRSLEVGGA